MRAAHGAPSDVRLPDTGVRALFTLAARRQRYLDVEAALAAAQVQTLLDPGTHTGQSAEIARQTAARTRSVINARGGRSR